MKKSILLPCAVLSSVIAMAPAHAARTNTQQALVEGGTFVGVTLAATVAAGPLGLIVGSIAAAMLAKETKLANENEIQLEHAVAQEKKLEHLLSEESMKVSQLEAETVAKLSFQILFATGEDKLSEIDLQRVNTLAKYLTENPELTVALNGHTDPRGTDEYNNILSIERAKAIKLALIALGINEERITSKGHGSNLSQAQKGDRQGYQQERRVDIEMSPKAEGGGVAQNALSPF